MISMKWEEINKIAINHGVQLSSCLECDDDMTEVFTVVSLPNMHHFKSLDVLVVFKSGNFEDFVKQIKEFHYLDSSDEMVKSFLQIYDDGWTVQLKDLLKEAETIIEVYKNTAEKFADAVSVALKNEKAITLGV